MDRVAGVVIGRPHRTTAPAALSPRFEQLFRDEYARVVRIAYRVLGELPAAEDVAQDIFLAFHRLHDPAAPFAAAWLHRAAAHRALNAARDRRRRRSRAAAEAALRTAPAEPEERALERERAAEVRAVLARLPGAQAELLALRHSGLGYRELSRATGIPADQVGTRLRRAHDAFRREVTRGPDRSR